MKSTEYAGFKGVDVRNDPAAMDQLALRRAVNVDLTIASAVRRRDGLRLLCTLSSESVGLFSANGFLRTVVVGGHSLQDSRPPDVLYDVIGDGTIYSLGTLSKLHRVETIGAATVSNALPYVVIERTSGVIEHHWLTASPVLSTDAVSTRVRLPFDPGKLLIKSNNKLFANDPSNGVLWYSSTANGPTDWVAPRDAGFINVRQHISGSRNITSLGYYRGGLVAVLFEDAISLWKMDSDPTKFQLETTFNGPGTSAPGATSNVLGDLFYLSRGGVRSLSVTSVTGETNETDIGAYIQALTGAIDLSTVTPVSLWSQTRSQYICAFGTEVWAYTYSPLAKVRGWTKWVLPVSVDFLVEHDGNLYIRSGNDVYIFDSAQVKDYDSVDVNYDVQMAFIHARAQGRKKFWKFFDTVQDGATSVAFHTDPVNDLTALTANTIAVGDTTYTGGLVGVNTVSDVLSLRFTGTQPWRLDSYTLHYDLLGVM